MQEEPGRVSRTIWRHDETGNPPDALDGLVIGIAYDPSTPPRGFTGQATATHNPPGRANGLPDVPLQSVTPQLLFVLPKPLQLRGTDSGQVHHLELGCCTVGNSDTPRTILMRSNHGLNKPHSPKADGSSAGVAAPFPRHSDENCIWPAQQATPRGVHPLDLTRSSSILAALAWCSPETPNGCCQSPQVGIARRSSS